VPVTAALFAIGATAPDLTASESSPTLAQAIPEAPADFSDRDLGGLDLSDLGFRGANLAAANLTAAALTDANLSRSNLVRAPGSIGQSSSAPILPGPTSRAPALSGWSTSPDLEVGRMKRRISSAPIYRVRGASRG
jgi:hypothetical protein